MSTTCTSGMAFFPANFMLQTSNATDNDDHHHHHHNHPPTSSLSSLLPGTQDFHGMAPMLSGKRSMSFSGIDMCDVPNVNHHQHHHNMNNNNNNGEEDYSDDGSQLGGMGEKKRRLNMEQVKTLEKNFELGNKLEPDRKMQLAKALGLQPRQIAIWFQNRRARWKTKQLEKDYEVLKSQFDALKADNQTLQSQNHKLQAEIIALKNREPTESINLNKDTEGSCSNRSENSTEIKLDISRSTPATSESPLDHPAQPKATTATTTTTASGRALFPPSSVRPSGPQVAQLLFQQSPQQQQQQPAGSSVKEENFTSMFCGIDDQTAFWPWLEQQNFN